MLYPALRIVMRSKIQPLRGDWESDTISVFPDLDSDLVAH
jgi:hypothetical protein